MIYVVSDDGITHINVYSKGATWLGRMLSHFAHIPFACIDGKFHSVEGYWYWLSVDPDAPERERLRWLHGFTAKQLGRQLRGEDWIDTPEFQQKICAANTAKLANSPKLQQALADNKLPLAHYYVYGGAVVVPAEGQWILDHLNYLAEVYRGSKL